MFKIKIMNNELNIKIKNCNNIYIESIIKIKENFLNLKYWINWTWKSTISKAIYSKINWEDLEYLKPFKYKENNTEKTIVEWLDNFKKCLIFNEEYIQQYVFKENEVIWNSFEIFIENEKYKSWMEEINKNIEKLKNFFINDNNINKLIDDLWEYNKAYWDSEKIHKSKSFFKWIWEWNLLSNIPEWLEDYEDYIKTKNINWLDWQIKWKNFIDLKEDTCPYCVEWIKHKKEKVLKISTQYDTKKIEHTKKILDIIEWLKEYFNNNTLENIKEIVNNWTGLSEDQIDFLFEIKKEWEKIYERLNKIKNLNFFNLKEIDSIENEIEKNLKIDLNFYNYFNSDYSKEKINLVNIELNNFLKEIWKLKWSINKQKDTIKNLLNNYEEEINYFLKTAWYKYIIKWIEENNKYKIILTHEDFNNNIHWKNHLSFWEKNALAIVLFMYQCLNENADFIIFDDPISSFDKNKKFAILNMLFNWYKKEDLKDWNIKWKNLRWKTILMLTHDFDPILDIFKNKLKNLDLDKKEAFFIENNNWKIIETEIKEDDIKNYTEIMLENIEEDNILSLIYLRRFYEINNNKWIEYQLLSNLLHKREIPFKKIKWLEKNLTEEEIKEWENKIKKYLKNFSYKNYINKTNTSELIKKYKKTSSNYEKLQLYRIIFDWEYNQNAVIMKFINETFHIENDYLFQLNPKKFKLIPDYIIHECNNVINNIKDKES